mmetsp:Transcript_61315/g.159257  ORF Transcript_61315/g.159257 Transcript_61315/m.159257 type:complete len:688 (-) Transcript_61315:227-2290(-)
MADGGFQPGDSVVARQLKSYNGQMITGAEGIIMYFDTETGQYEVSFDGLGEIHQCRPVELSRKLDDFAEATLAPGDNVIAQGLQSGPGQQLNGAQGVVQMQDTATGRYHVDFGPFGCKAFKAENLMPAAPSAGGASSAGSAKPAWSQPAQSQSAWSAAAQGASGKGGKMLAPTQGFGGKGGKMLAPASRTAPPQQKLAAGSMPSIAEACEAAARGATSGETVQDSEITVFDPNERPIQPQIFTSFEQCVQFPDKIIAQLKGAGFPGPSQIQSYAWPLALQGKDVIGIAATGSGKTLAFLLPAFSEFFKSGHNPYRDGAGLLVMSPTRELAQQIETEANRFGKCIGMWTVSMYGGSPKWDQLNLYRKGVHAIIACPGRLNDFLEAGSVDVQRVKKLVLDEADRMLDMGFEPQIKKILARLPAQRHNMFFTATWPREVRQLASSMLNQPFRVMIGNRDKLTANQDVMQQVRSVGKGAKKEALMSLLNEAGLNMPGSAGKALVFAGTKKMCEELSNDLYHAGVSCAAIHGDRDQRQRDQALRGLKTGQLRVLVATDVAARGLDIKGVGLVVNYDVPQNTEDYVHRIGRTGRAGAKGYAISFLTPADAWLASGIVKVMESTNQEVSPELRAMCRGGGGGGINRWGGGGGWGGGGKGGGGGSKPCVWCAKGECWTHKNGGGGKGRSRSPKKW